MGKAVNPSIRTYINKIKNRSTFKIKTVYYVKLLTPEKLKITENNFEAPKVR